MKIANKINLSFSIVVVILLSISLFTFYTIAKTNLENAIYAHLSTTAQSRAHHIKTFLEKDKTRLALLAESDLIEDTVKEIIRNKPNSKESEEDLSLILKDFAKAEKEAYELLILNPDGKIIASTTNEESIGADRSSNAYFLAGKEGTYIKDAYYSEMTRKETYAISTPLRDDNTKELLGVLVGRFTMDELNEITNERTGLGETGEIYIVNKYGYMITSSRFTEDTFLKQKVDTVNFRISVATHSGTHAEHGLGVFPDYRGVMVLGAYDYIQEMQWSLLAEIDEKEALAPLAKMKLVFIIIFCAVPVVVWTVGMFVSRAITAPIHKLHRGTEIIGEGDLDYKVGTDTKDEIGQLSRAFDKMTEDLKGTTTSIDSLNAANQQLKAREQQLKAANQQLQAKEQQLKASNQQLRANEEQLRNNMRDLEREVTERKQAEQNLKAAKERAELIFRVVPSAIFSVDKEKHITSWNNKVVEITGYTAEEALGKKCTMFTLAPCVDKCGLYSNDVEKPVIAGECTIKRKDGEIRTILKNADFLKDTNGNIIGGIESFEDVTELKQIEQEQEELLHNLGERVKELDCMYGVADSIRRRTTLDEIFKDVVAIMPQAWHYTYITRAKICLDGVEYISEPFTETPWKQTSDIIVNGELCGCIEVYYLEECPELDEGPFAKEERDLINGIARALSEAVERKRAEEKVKDLAKFPSEDPNPILRISKDCEILYANDASSSILKAWGCKVGQYLPQSQSKLVEEVLNSGKVVTFELGYRDEVFSVTMAPVAKSGYVNAYGLDVTELKLSKEHLKHAREQAEVKSRFVSTVSHELRTPLATMKESVNIVLDGIAGEINNKQRHFLDIATRNIDRLARFINDVLDFQKLQAGRMDVDLQRNDINEVVEEVIETMASSANEKGLELIAKLDETVSTINFDKDRIIQVLVNLVNNAIKFTEKGNITIATTEADNTVRISIHDTGPGIKKENLPKLFHEFEQLSDSHERKTGGTGLGLSISKKIVEKHNGKIWAESEFGKGTIFYFELPVQEELAMAAKV